MIWIILTYILGTMTYELYVMVLYRSQLEQLGAYRFQVCVFAILLAPITVPIEVIYNWKGF